MPITTTAYTLAFKEQNRFTPVCMKGQRNKQFAVLHPIFLLKKQAVEYRDNGMKELCWKVKPDIVKVQITT